ncbi:MAG: NusG domain II-containing protein, partial [Eubacterium sp.]|nr:NusG domain II-containing protein [Eubacterium sp.]
DDKVHGTYPLEEDQTISIRGEDFVSILVIRDGMADMTEADCPDQICVRHSSIHFRGETIICLPHKVVVEVVSEGEGSTGGIDSISR